MIRLPDSRMPQAVTHPFGLGLDAWAMHIAEMASLQVSLFDGAEETCRRTPAPLQVSGVCQTGRYEFH